LSEWNDPGYAGHPLYVVVDILISIWEAFFMILQIAGWFLQLFSSL